MSIFAVIGMYLDSPYFLKRKSSSCWAELRLKVYIHQNKWMIHILFQLSTCQMSCDQSTKAGMWVIYMFTGKPLNLHSRPDTDIHDVMIDFVWSQPYSLPTSTAKPHKHHICLGFKLPIIRWYQFNTSMLWCLPKKQHWLVENLMVLSKVVLITGLVKYEFYIIWSGSTTKQGWEER